MRQCREKKNQTHFLSKETIMTDRLTMKYREQVTIKRKTKITSSFYIHYAYNMSKNIRIIRKRMYIVINIIKKYIYLIDIER